MSTPDTHPPPAVGPRPRWSLFKTLVRMLFAFFVAAALFAVCAGAAALLVYRHALRQGVAQDFAAFTIPAGASNREVGELLSEAGFLEHAVFFRVALLAHSPEPRIRQGTYRLGRGLSARQLLEQILEGPETAVVPGEVPDELRVTVPEGLSIAQMAALFEEPEALIEAARDEALSAELGLDVPSLEGFLMPNTYYFDEKPSPSQVVARMARQFRLEYNKLLESHPALADRDLLQIVTVASLVEEEARVPDERPLIAAVIYNRLEKGMTLDMDSTLQFALGKYGQRMLDADKAIDSPYNTYKNAGLPPGPISNPGIESLKAAIAPADVDYLYFVSNADGKTHTFSSTIAEHNRAVARYRREIAEQRRALGQ